MGAPDPLAELDALRTERNAAVAEAKLWLRRLGAIQRERDEARANLHACNKCLGEWQEAYDDLLRDLRRTQMRLADALGDIDRNADFVDTHLWPLALARLQQLIAEAPDEPRDQQ